MAILARFNGDPDPIKRAEGTPGLVRYCGISMPMNQLVDVTRLTAPQLAKLRANPHFEVVEEVVEPEEAPAAAPARPIRTAHIRTAPARPHPVTAEEQPAEPAPSPAAPALSVAPKPPRIVKAKSAPADEQDVQD